MRSLALVSLTLVMLVGTAIAQDTGWLLRQADLQVATVTGTLDASGDGDALAVSDGARTYGAPAMGRSGRSPAIPMLMSLALPGAGEAYLGHKRGYLQMALDVGSWVAAAHYNDKGEDKKLEYYDYADEHWSEEKLAAAYDANWSVEQPYWDPDFDYMAGDGLDYFNTEDTPLNDYTDLPLWVSVEDDRREYYENLGKWDQFVFGWDDYTDPRLFLDDETVNIRNLQDPRTSARREVYRDMRQASNDYFSKRDRFIYLSVAFRLFSVLQVAYLEGLLFGGGNGGQQEPSTLSMAGHEIDIFVEPVGISRGVLGAKVSF